MNKFFRNIGLVAVALIAVCNAFSANAEIQREHRAIWMSPFLGSNWPSSAITTANAESHKRILRNQLDKFQAQNINVLYYHVRSMCDANYESSYEPWSKNISGTRGVAPAFDPFAYIIEQAHLRGIEVYGWVNPYRYHASKGGSWGTHELNYETSHPEWLMDGNSNNRVLNPGIAEVRQRIVDVCKEIVTKYDVDGIIFDDYFYPQGGTSESSSAPDYAQYKASGTTMSMGDWRRANVNQMLNDVYTMIKSTKPYVCFGVSPAGSANPPDISKYGLPAGPEGDWQYNTIYSDPVAWLNAGTLDFISPQVYWTIGSSSDFVGLTSWWGSTAHHFGRHLYESVNLKGDGLTDLNTHGAEESLQQILWIRDKTPENTSGVVFFEYSGYVNYSEKYNGGTRQTFGDILKTNVFQNKVLTPLRPWNNTKKPAMVSNVTLSGTTLSWNAVSGMRYTIYAVPNSVTDAEFGCQREYLQAITYANSYTIPDDKTSGYRWAVAVYDRYGNEYAPLFVGKTATTIAAPTLVSPINGAKAPALFSFKWSGGTRGVVEVAADAAFTKILGTSEAAGNSLSSAVFPWLENGKTYYWRVTNSAPNAQGSTSAVQSFVPAPIEMTYPTNGATGVSMTPTLKCSAAESGVEYVWEVSDREDFANLLYTGTSTTNSITVPASELSSYYDYYARVTVYSGEKKLTSATVKFKTVEKSYTDTPVIAYPATDGATVYSNEPVRLNPWSGYRQVKVQISTSTSFPSRSSKLLTLSDFATATADMGTLSLKDGTTYYVRAYGEYGVSSSTTLQKTGYSAVRSFVYSSEAGIDGVVGDEQATIYVTADDQLMLGGIATYIEIYTLDGKLVKALDVTELPSLDLSSMASGAYIIRVATVEGVKTLKFVR